MKAEGRGQKAALLEAEGKKEGRGKLKF